jgi:hypothetical protein
MKRATIQSDAYILDTYKSGGMYHAGAITFHGRRKLETLRWDDKSFKSEQEANAFVRSHFSPLGLTEAVNEGELAGSRPVWSMRLGNGSILRL